MKSNAAKYIKMSETERAAESKRLAAKLNKILHNGKYEGELAERMRKEMGIKGAEKPEQ